jgi:hypothetical protein
MLKIQLVPSTRCGKNCYYQLKQLMSKEKTHVEIPEQNEGPPLPTTTIAND